MLIGVNVRLLIKNRVDGIARFSYETLKRITSNHPEHRFIFYFDRFYPDEFVFNSNIQPVIIPPPTRRPFLNNIWFEYTLPYILKKHKPDLFLSPDGLLSLKSDIPALPVIHDLNFEYHPEWLPANYFNYYKKRFPLFARKAARIATVSDYSKTDIANLYDINPELIDVVYNGVSDKFGIADTGRIAETRKKYARGLPYFLFVGSLHPRKNIKNTLLAFDAYREKSTEKKLLLIAGEKSYWTTEMQQTFNNLRYKDDVVFIGSVNDDVLAPLYAAAHALIYVSFFEGFGIPLIEAMQSGIPVVAADCTSIPEIAGNAALLADPYSVNAIAEKILMLDDVVMRKKLIELGLKRAQKFTWDNSAALLWQSVEKTFSQLS